MRGKIGIIVVLWMLSISVWAVALPNAPYTTSMLQQSQGFTSFAQPPKTLDPAKAYNELDWQFIQQVYEPLYAYDPYDHDYRLIPLSAKGMPKVEYIDQQGHRLEKRPDDVSKIAKTLYRISLREDLFYFPHPSLKSPGSIPSFSYKVPYRLPLRRVIADDFVYAVERLANPKVGSPLVSVLVNQIEGFYALSHRLARCKEDCEGPFDLGVRAEGPFLLQIETKGYKPQFIYWLATPFFSPIPREVGQKKVPLDLDPVGSGAYGFLDHQNHYRMVLAKNPYYRAGSAKGEALPKTPQVLFSLEKESIPRWYKFMHGYYDQSGIGSDQFAQVMRFDAEKGLHLQPNIEEKGIYLSIHDEPAIIYWVFNQNDPVVGGRNKRSLLLRRAIAEVFDWQSYIAVFLNGRGQRAATIIPPGIEGHEPYHAPVLGKKERLIQAKAWLKEAGYDGGIDPATGQALLLHFLTSGTGSPEEQSRLNWFRQQLGPLGIVLNIEVVPYARYLDRIARGDMQMTISGWKADYPDPENFLFLFTSDQMASKNGGQNTSNYNNPSFDRCYQKVRDQAPGASRAHQVQHCVALLKQDLPAMFGYFPKTYILSHSWVQNYHPHGLNQATFKYTKRDPNVRLVMQKKWNQPRWYVLVGVWVVLLVFVFATVAWVRHRSKTPAVSRKDRHE